MKRTLITLFLVTISVKSYSQDYKFDIELSYINPFDHNFIANNYDGTIDLATKYRFVNSKKIDLGISLNLGLLKSNYKLDRYYGDLNIKSYLVQPRIFAEFNLKKFHPKIGIGYTSMIFNSSVSDFKIAILRGNNGYRNGFSVNNTQSGINLNTGLSYDISPRFLIQIQYDYIILSTDEPIINSKYNTNVNILKFGIGFRL